MNKYIFSFVQWQNKYHYLTRSSDNLRSYKYCTFRMQLALYVCYCVYAELFIGSISKDIFRQNLPVQIYKYTTYLLTFLSAASVQRYTYCTSE